MIQNTCLHYKLTNNNHIIWFRVKYHFLLGDFIGRGFFCMFRQMLSCPPIHSVPGRRYFHEITLRDNPPFHPLTDLDAGKNLRVTGKKKATTAWCIKGFVFAYFFHARNHITFCQVILQRFQGDDQHRQSSEGMVIVLFSILFCLYFPPHQATCRKAVRS